MSGHVAPIIDPRKFRITGPAVVNVSGGRTSGYMLHLILDAHDGKLPPDVVAVFCNTGREMPATLDFVDEMARRWGVHIQWLEYRRDPKTGHVWSEPVSHNSASRQGEPYRALLLERQMLPNPVMRFCTTELKVRVLKRWVIGSLGWSHWISYVGLRFDELHRVIKKAIGNAQHKERWRVSCPLAKARITKKGHVLPFWARQSFDLGLAGDWEGNCDFCFLKSRAAKRRMIETHPDLVVPWIQDERDASRRGKVLPSVAQYRKEYSFAQLVEEVRRSPRLPALDDEAIEPFDILADCEGGCGV